MKKLIIAIVIFTISLCFAGISTTTNIMPAQVCTTDTFTFTFPINSTSDLKVITINTSSYDVNTLTISTDYTVSATNNDYSSGGTVTTASTYGSGYKLIIYRDTELTQSTTLISDSGVLRTRQLVSALDKQMMILQDVQEQTDRSLKFPIDINSVSAEIPSQTERAGKYLAFNSSGLPVATSVITTGTTSFSTFGEDVVSAANAAALQALINYPILRDGTITYTDNQPMGGYKITGYGTPSDENDVVDVNYVKDSTITLKNKTLESPTLTTPTITSPVINTGVSGTAIDNDGNMAGNSATKLATQYATKKYADTNRAFGAFTNLDSENNAMVRAHAYLAMQDGFVTAWSSAGSTKTISGYVGSTTDPAGAGTLVASQNGYSTTPACVFFPVQSGKYFEITNSLTEAVNIYWHPIGTLQKPVDQD